ncbi:MAG: MoaD/ThiS family protein [Candidatus Bathyarchaeota archaeon]|nr:MoaD/ThiS family protein [Candidatus Bathyarchaeota archaeon]
MQVRVRLMGVLKEAAGQSELTLDVESGADVGSVISKLLEGRELLESTLWDPVVDSYTPNALVLLNGVEVSNLQGKDTPVSDGSEMVFLSVTHGG